MVRLSKNQRSMTEMTASMSYQFDRIKNIRIV